MLNRLLKGVGGASTPELSTAEVMNAYNNEVRIVDVREPDEWATGHIPGAVHIPLGELAARTGEIARDKPVVVVCRSGRRSLAGAQTLIDAGFSKTSSLAGGMLDWASDGHTVERS